MPVQHALPFQYSPDVRSPRVMQWLAEKGKHLNNRQREVWGLLCEAKMTGQNPARYIARRVGISLRTAYHWLNEIDLSARDNQESQRKEDLAPDEILILKIVKMLQRNAITPFPKYVLPHYGTSVREQTMRKKMRSLAHRGYLALVRKG